MVEGLVKELGDVVVVEGVHHGAAFAGASHEAEMAQQAELVGAGGLLQTDLGGQLGRGERALA